ncbi:lytic transglycosylase domain-containing protein [Nocardia sp. NPDC088792]|uniref:lytic transglycosylase domain-containing protein n=1 Tax=Nocardia sp. NPDC088792 TaxID=3364332 RepID=UPI00382F2287
MTASALLIAGLVTAGSATNTTVHTAAAPQAAPEALLAASAAGNGAQSGAAPSSDQLVGLVPAAPDAPRKLSAMTPPADGGLPGSVPLQNVALPGGTGVLGIPELVLAAYRNAELAMQTSEPNCHLPWYLLAGIGRIESNHANNGHTDAAGTTTSPIYGPALDGTLAGNEVIKATDGSYVRAIGPMQFLPGTWAAYAANGKGSGTPDPNNVFDAALAAGKYLCSGGLDLADPAQELKAVLRYNNSMAYASNVLSWANAYKTGAAPTQVNISPDLIPPNSWPANGGPDITVASGSLPADTTTTTTQAPQPAATTQQPTQVMITIPGLPPIPCGIFCPAPAPVNPCQQATIPAQQDKPDTKPEDAKPADDANKAANADAEPQDGVQPGQAQEQKFGPDGKPVTPDPATANCTVQNPNQPQNQPQPAVQPNQGQPAAPDQQQPVKTTDPAPMAPAPQANQAPESAPTTTVPAPAITLPFGITIPVPVLPAPAPAPAPAN